MKLQKIFGGHLFSFLILASSGCTSATKNEPHPKADVPQVKQWDGSIASARESRVQPIAGTKGMVVADDVVAAEWGAEILRRGGSAVDAAVATAFAMSVTRPQFASLGGGGFLMYCPHQSECKVIDYREIAPGAATRDMFVKNGKVVPDLSDTGPLSLGVPGVPAGLLAALEKYGKLSRQVILKKPIELAKNGSVFTTFAEAQTLDRWADLNDDAKRILGCGGTATRLPTAPCTPGTQIKQPALMRVLQEISKKGVKGFYEGWVAKKLVDGVQKAGGVLSLNDLATYRPRFRKPLIGKFQDYEVITMPPPSNGGAALLQMLGYAERADHQGELADGYGSARTVHALAHGMSLAFADRAQYFGDPDQISIPLEQLLSPAYLDGRWKTFDAKKANIPTMAGDVYETPHESRETTHISVIDREGNAVAITTSINTFYGSGFVPHDTGVFMNDTMDDFAAQPGVPNGAGLIASEKNAIAPHKIPVSSMMPTVVRDSKGEVRLVLGAAGGPVLVTSIFNCMLNHLRFGMSLPDAIAAGRFHHQWRPNLLRFEAFMFPSEIKQRLQSMGYTIKDQLHQARIYGLERFSNGRVWGGPDPRGEGTAVQE